MAGQEFAEGFRFPPGFLWGAATAAHQVEGDNRASDWWAAEESGRLPHRSGRACDHLRRYEADFDLARAFGHNAHRLSLEWSRLEPEPGLRDEAAFGHYERVLEALRARGLEPVVTLHHFTAPRWFAERGGWLAADALDRFAAHCDAVVERFGSQIRWWITVNEPTVLAKHGWVTGDWPPFVRGRWDLAFRVIHRLCAAHRRAYRRIHARVPGALVSFAHSIPWIEPCDPSRTFDRLAARLRTAFLVDWCFGRVREAGRLLLDYVAVNYYTRSIVRWRPRGRALLFGVDCHEPHHGPRLFDDLDQELWPEGLLQVLRRCARLGLPVLVTENGIATTDDGLRLAHLRGHLEALARALAEGVELRGYLHWSLMDNFEWAKGTTARFGLAATDLATLERRPRPAMRLLAEVARTGRLAPTGSEVPSA
ncbi:MAG: family 1 glycosylhydrolase [Geminicoccaceae bacterium]|nr:family 1 glycosylhydrolase [Geminicoccaceae bacterium]